MIVFVSIGEAVPRSASRRRPDNLVIAVYLGEIPSCTRPSAVLLLAMAEHAGVLIEHLREAAHCPLHEIPYGHLRILPGSSRFEVFTIQNLPEC